MRRGLAALAAAVLADAGLALVVPASAASGAGHTTRVSVGTDGVPGNAPSRLADVSGDGRFVAFDSASSTLVAEDTNGVGDVFVRDRVGGTTMRVSVSSAGEQGNGASDSASISRDGRWVAFTSAASNLVTGDTNGARDVFVHDRLTATTSRVSVQSSGAQAAGNSFTPQISGDGSHVVFFTFSDLAGTGTAMPQVNAYRVDLTTGQVDDVCVRWDDVIIRLCLAPSISADGRYVAFEAQGKLTEDDTNSVTDIYVRDMTDRVTRRVSVSTTGNGATGPSSSPSISADGTVVAFTSPASNLVADDTNGMPDVFARDLAGSTTERVSVGPLGAQANAGSFTRPFNGGSRLVSDDGRYVAFHSFASNLVPSDPNGANDLFVRDRTGATTVIASLTSDDLPGSGNSLNAAISADGRYVTFESSSPNLVVDDTNAVNDVFIRDLRPGPPPVTYTDRRTGISMSVQLDPEASDVGRMTFTVPGLGTYVFDAGAGMSRKSATTVLIDHAGPAVLECAAGSVALSVELKARLDSDRPVAEATLADSAGRRFHFVARP